MNEQHLAAVVDPVDRPRPTEPSGRGPYVFQGPAPPPVCGGARPGPSTIQARAIRLLIVLNNCAGVVSYPSSQGKVVHHSFSIVSSFSQRVRLLQIHSLTDDKRFYYRRLKTSRDELEPKRKSKVLKACL